jgi:hypothetical protein
MKEAYIDIKKIAGSDTVSREHGRRIRKVIELYFKSKDRIVIDFSNLSIASPSFIDEAFAKLLLKYSIDEVKQRLAFINMSDFDRALLNDLIIARLRERGLLEKTPKGKFQLAVKRNK